MTMYARVLALQSDRAQKLLDQVETFMAENVYPNEHVFNAHQVSGATLVQVLACVASGRA